MNGSNPRRLLVIALVAALATIAVFQLALHLRVQEELNNYDSKVTTPEYIRVLPGFKVELLYIVPTNQGSWISMTRDPQGRLIVAPEHASHLLRVTLARGKVAQIEPIRQPVGDAMGMFYADDCLYLDGNGPKGWGIYRLHSQGDDFAAPEFLRSMVERTLTEHGSHGIVMGPDHKIYIVCGDYAKVPPDVLASSPLRNYGDDQLLPRAEDGRGFGAGLPPPGGFVMRMDTNGQNCELFAAGTRNTYSIAFSPEGELFGFDNDPEMDFGMAWYRPNRVYHWVAGGDYGYRQGSGKCPGYYEDTLPATLNVGIGSAGGVKFGTDSNFPKFYRDACFMEDWAYGRLFAVHFIPHDATYDATIETVLRGLPLNMTALEFGLDGDLYFITGGWKNISGLYRLSYVGPRMEEQPETKARQASDQAGKAARSLRRQLESFQGHSDPRALEILWPSLNSQDRWIRYAARTALEFQDVAWWKDRALTETNTEGGLTALLALARCGGRATQPGLLGALAQFPFSRLTRQQALLKLRVMELSFIRQGRPSPTLAGRARETLDPLYPAADEDLNEELCQLLLYLQAPDAVAKTVALLDKAPTQEEQTYYVMRLRTITNGWTLDLRRDYLGWFQKDHDRVRHRPDILQYFHDVGMRFREGTSFELFLDHFQHEAVASLNPDERKALAAYMPKPPAASPAVRARAFVKQWRMADLEPDLGMVQWPRSHARGRAIFREVGCVLCHSFANSGGSVGPDLTAVGSRMTARGILESILEPSKVLPGQYQNTLLTLRDGDVLAGRVLEENKQRLVFMTDLIQRTSVEIRQEDVVSRRASLVSPMPEDLANSLTEDDIWNLIAFLESGSKPAPAALHQ